MLSPRCGSADAEAEDGVRTFVHTYRPRLVSACGRVRLDVPGDTKSAQACGGIGRGAADGQRKIAVCMGTGVGVVPARERKRARAREAESVCVS